MMLNVPTETRCHQTTYLLFQNVSSVLSLPGLAAGVGGSLDSCNSLEPLWSGMGDVVPARTSPPLHPPIPSHCAVITLFKSVSVHQLS